GFRNRPRIFGDHRRAAAERKRTVVEDDLGLAYLNAAPTRQRYLLFEYRAVVKRAVGRSQILEKVFIPLAAHFGMHTRRERIGNAQIVTRRAANRDTQAVDRKMLGGAIRIFDNQLSHCRFCKEGVSLRRLQTNSLHYASCVLGFCVGATMCAPYRRTTTVPAIKSCRARPLGFTAASRKPRPNGSNERGYPTKFRSRIRAIPGSRPSVRSMRK